MTNNIRTRLNKLHPAGEQYVLELAKNPKQSTSDILKRIEIGRTRFYELFDADARDELERLAREINRDIHFQALQLADEHAQKAVQKLITLMDTAKSEYVQLQAAQTIIDRALGAATQRFEGQVDVTHDWRQELANAGHDPEKVFNELVQHIANK